MRLKSFLLIAKQRAERLLHHEVRVTLGHLIEVEASVRLLVLRGNPREHIDRIESVLTGFRQSVRVEHTSTPAFHVNIALTVQVSDVTLLRGQALAHCELVFGVFLQDFLLLGDDALDLLKEDFLFLFQHLFLVRPLIINRSDGS